ncbi:hypothetical protein C1645_783314 [Glomus cerebriforme]|uniref:Uncharacterized protein n=1 Tax=Glomus cerebriforme TaxID=658196 RepID=A0A397SLH5_9GLOM|nr:hypothetical protein C1645_783314 [Glomus cerebriforme]
MFDFYCHSFYWLTCPSFLIFFQSPTKENPVTVQNQILNKKFIHNYQPTKILTIPL